MKNFFYAATIIAFSQLLFAQDDNENEVEEGLPLKATRAIDINTNEGTWISLDVHPSGEKIIFDLLGDIYELPISGGKANRITEGLAFDSQPKYSPDGNSILFLSVLLCFSIIYYSFILIYAVTFIFTKKCSSNT